MTMIFNRRFPRPALFCSMVKVTLHLLEFVEYVLTGRHNKAFDRRLLSFV